MDSEVIISDQALANLQSKGELRVTEQHGVTLVLMTLDARQQLGTASYDDSEWQPAESMAVLSQQLDDIEGMGAPSMDEYDRIYGHLFDADH